VIEVLKKTAAPVLLILNKDLVAPQRAQDVAGWWKKRIEIAEVIEISALQKEDTTALLSKITGHASGRRTVLPGRSADRPAGAFFVGEIIRENFHPVRR
jgi:GTPase Era involved in 16S rRNA processing